MKIRKIDRTAKSGILNLLIKPIGLLLTLVYTPLLLNYLGDEKYGLWATILSVISWINYFDIGIGQGLRNSLTEDIERQDYENARRTISTAYIVVSIISGCIFVILACLTFAINWTSVFSTEIDLRLTLFITFAFICVNFVLALANSVLYALHLAEWVSIRGCIVQIVNIVGILILRNISSGNLVYMALLFGASTCVIYIGNFIQLVKKYSYLKPKISKYDRLSVSRITNIGIKFFIIQIMGLLMFTVDDLIITHFWGPTLVTPFSVVNKVFSTGYSCFAAFLIPYWSGTTSAVARGDIKWIKNSIKKIACLLIIFAIGCIAVTLCFKPVIAVWLGKNLDYQNGIIPLMCLFYILYSILGVESYFINGTGLITTQMIMYLIVGIINIPLSIFLGVKCNLQTVGVRLATTILLLFADAVLAFNLKSILTKIERESLWNKSN